MNEVRYRHAEARLFDGAGVAPSEHRVTLARVGTEARVLEVGTGKPVVFLTGGPMAAATWAYVAAHLEGFRCLFLERPGTGLSAPLAAPPAPDELATYVADLTADVIEGFGLVRASVVGSSFGGYSALCAAAAYPQLVERVVLAGCPAFVPGWRRPAFFDLVRLPVVGKLLLSLPATQQSARMFLRQMGHAAALAEGRIPRAMVDWTRAWQRDTDTMRNDVAMIKRAAFDASVDLDDDDFKRVTAPCLFISGTNDPVGDDAVVSDVARRLIDAEVAVWRGAGHLPWLDDAPRFAASVAAFV